MKDSWLFQYAKNITNGGSGTYLIERNQGDELMKCGQGVNARFRVESQSAHCGFLVCDANGAAILTKNAPIEQLLDMKCPMLAGIHRDKRHAARAEAQRCYVEVIVTCIFETVANEWVGEVFMALPEGPRG